MSAPRLVTTSGFLRILTAALPDVPPRLREALALLCRRYAGAEADAGTLEREALFALAPTDPPPQDAP